MTFRSIQYYQHPYTKKWYVASEDCTVFKEFNTEAEATAFILSFCEYKVLRENGQGRDLRVEYFRTEKDARSYANRCYKLGYGVIELYKSTRTGYKLIQEYRKH